MVVGLLDHAGKNLQETVEEDPREETGWWVPAETPTLKSVKIQENMSSSRRTYLRYLLRLAEYLVGQVAMAMANSMVVIKVSCLAVVMMCMVLGVPQSHGALTITCKNVQPRIRSCIEYLKGSGSVVPQPCCNGVRTLNSEANSTAERQALCVCIISAAKSLPAGLNHDKIAALPAKCGVNLPFKLTPSMDCNKYGSVSSSGHEEHVNGKRE
ncbi:Plant lipid transfer protein/Par allergen [Sesbania bispinosa]|nr:Plant lipid transfer protein/Par allergen [Sesbania bispinosa]